MPKKKPRPGKGAGRGLANTVTGRQNFNPARAPNQHRSTPSPALDLAGLRNRLVSARSRLVERLAEDFPPDRRFPDSGWTRMLADIEIAIMAVDDVIAEG